MDRVEKRAPNGVPNSSVLLRDQFIENVLDPSLRRALKQSVRDNPAATLLNIRSEALTWEREGRAVECRPRSYSVPSICAAHTSSSPSEIAELKEMFKRQQEQLNVLSERVIQLHSTGRPRPVSRNGPVICRRCNQPGHFASHCDNDRVPQVSQPCPSPREAAPSQPSGN